MDTHKIYKIAIIAFLFSIIAIGDTQPISYNNSTIYNNTTIYNYTNTSFNGTMSGDLIFSPPGNIRGIHQLRNGSASNWSIIDFGSSQYPAVTIYAGNTTDSRQFEVTPTEINSIGGDFNISGNNITGCINCVPYYPIINRVAVNDSNKTSSRSYCGVSTYYYLGANYSCDKAFNAVTSGDDGWSTSVGNVTNLWIYINFSYKFNLSYITVVNGNDNALHRGLKNCILEGSNDSNTTWHLIPADSWSNGAIQDNSTGFQFADNETQQQIIGFNSTIPYSMYRIYAYNNWGNTVVAGTREWGLYSYEDISSPAIQLKDSNANNWCMYVSTTGELKTFSGGC